MLSFFRGDSPTGTYDDPASPYLSHDDSHAGSDSDTSSYVSSRRKDSLVDTLQLELKMRDERIKELEQAHEELLRKSQFNAGQLIEELKKVDSEKKEALERAEQLARQYHNTQKDANIAVEEKNKANDCLSTLPSDKLNTKQMINKKSSTQQKKKPLETHQGTEKEPYTSKIHVEAHKSNAQQTRKPKSEEALVGMDAEKRRAEEVLEAEKQRAAEAVIALEAEKQRAAKAVEAEKYNADIAIQVAKKRYEEALKANEMEKRRAEEAVIALEADRQRAAEA
ncbi:R27-2 protein, partial [Trypanosoma rangeli]